MSNTRKTVSSGVWIPDETLFQVFEIASLKPLSIIDKYSPRIILGEIQSKSSPEFMLIKIQFPNHHRGS